MGLGEKPLVSKRSKAHQMQPGDREDNLGWKMTLDGRRLLMDNTLRWKTTFNVRQPSMEDDIR